METHWKLKLILLLSALSIIIVACYQSGGPDDQPKDKLILTIEEELATAGYEQISRWTLSQANQAYFELTALEIKISGPDSQWGRSAPSFLLSFSLDQGVTWQDSLLVWQQPPLYIQQYAFYYVSNKVISDQDLGSINVYCKP